MIKLKKEIALAKASVRKKFQALRRGAEDYQIEAEKKFRPLLQPLKKMVGKENIHAAPKLEPKVEAKPETSFIQPEFMDESLTDYYLKTPRESAPVASSSRQTPRTSRSEEYEYDPDTEQEVDREQMFQNLFYDMGPMSQQYMRAIITNSKLQDTVFGIRHVPSGRNDRGHFELGKKEIDFDKHDNIHIGTDVFVGTPGLFSLIFLKNPPKNVVTKRDMDAYKDICELTNLHKVDHHPQGRIKTGNWEKYTKYIRVIFPPQVKKKSGKGILIKNNDKKYNYIYYDQVSEIVERLQVLLAAKEAGNDNLDLEIQSIESELRQRGIIE